MYEVIFLFTLGLMYVIFASIQDLRKREVANWLNFSLIIFALGFRFFYSLFSDTNFNLFWQGLVGFGIFFIIGNFFYYGRIFAGGDAKLMISLGTILPLNASFYSNLGIFGNFLLIFLISSFFYVLIFSVFLAFSNKKSFKKEFYLQFKKNKYCVLIGFLAGIFIFISGLFFSEFYFFVSIILSFVSISISFIYIYASSVDKVCMVKRTFPEDLTEGDWLYKDVKIGNKTIKQNWEGLTKEEIRLLKKHKKIVLIRQGVPFVPVFLITLLIFIFHSLIYFNLRS